MHAVTLEGLDTKIETVTLKNVKLRDIVWHNGKRLRIRAKAEYPSGAISCRAIVLNDKFNDFTLQGNADMKLTREIYESVYTDKLGRPYN